LILLYLHVQICGLQGEIDAFLTPKEPGADQTPASSSTNDVGQKRKHSPAPEILPGAKAAKAEQKAVSEGSDGSSFFLSPLKRVEVRCTIFQKFTVNFPVIKLGTSAG
jgi:hypothetical protein